MEDYHHKYLKYKTKYLRLKTQIGGKSKLLASYKFDIPIVHLGRWNPSGTSEIKKIVESFLKKEFPKIMEEYINGGSATEGSITHYFRTTVKKPIEIIPKKNSFRLKGTIDVHWRDTISKDPALVDAKPKKVDCGKYQKLQFRQVYEDKVKNAKLIKENLEEFMEKHGQTAIECFANNASKNVRYYSQSGDIIIKRYPNGNNLEIIWPDIKLKPIR